MGNLELKQLSTAPSIIFNKSIWNDFWKEWFSFCQTNVHFFPE